MQTQGYERLLLEPASKLFPSIFVVEIAVDSLSASSRSNGINSSHGSESKDEGSGSSDMLAGGLIGNVQKLLDRILENESL